VSKRPRICLIDDDPMVRDALSLGLEDAGYDVVTIGDGEAGLALIARESIDAVVTDMNMPGLGGGQLIAALRAERPALPIIAISGGGEMGGRNVTDLARESGANLCLVKPFRARDIAAALDRLLPGRL
jgi:DNA-binding response OmpR family regulator